MRVYVGGSWWPAYGIGSARQTSLTPSETAAVELLEEWNRGRQEFIFTTSGSTGTPKVITFQRHQLEASAQLTIRSLDLKPGMTVLACLDCRYVAGAMMVIRSAVAGMDLIVRPPSSNPLVGLDEKVDFLAVVPLQLFTLLDECPEKLNKTSVVIVGGAPLGDAILPRLQGLSPTFIATYGMTETLTHVALQKLNGPERQDAFHLLPSVSGHLDDRGCLVIEAAHLGPKPIHTNDMVAWTADGGFRVTGRLDNVINSGGVKVQPDRVEQVVEGAFGQLSITRRFFVAGVPDERLQETVALVIEGSPLLQTSELQLKDLLTKQLEKFEMPRQFHYIDRFKETATQKINRAATLAEIKLRNTPALPEGRTREVSS